MSVLTGDIAVPPSQHGIMPGFGGPTGMRAVSALLASVLCVATFRRLCPDKALQKIISAVILHRVRRHKLHPFVRAPTIRWRQRLAVLAPRPYQRLRPISTGLQGLGRQTAGRGGSMENLPTGAMLGRVSGQRQCSGSRAPVHPARHGAAPANTAAARCHR